MSENILPHTPSAHALVGVSLCEAGRTIDDWSRALFLAALLSGLWIASPPPNFFALAAGVVFAGFEAWHALRLAFDRPIFAAWARCDDDALPEVLRGFDAVLAPQQGTAGDGTLRPLSARVAGVRRLLLCQAVCLGGQAASLVFVWSEYFLRAHA
ncbi:MAG: hypothetical protein LBL72_11455 [Candidatus Accumulibacter sp.]|jgi:hypothetical protein|nr:hypothetical protein [Accumulibacter sp.]